MAERIEEDSPPQRGRGQHVARFRRRRTARAPQFCVDLIEPRVEDEIVGARHGLFAADERQSIGRRSGAATPGGRTGTTLGGFGPIETMTGHEDRCRDGYHAGRGQQPRASRGADHVTLVRNCCFSVCRSSASAINRSSSAPYSTPEAAQSLEYMLIVVNPGMVFTSLT